MTNVICEECGVAHGEKSCVRSLQAQSQMQWENILALQNEVSLLRRGRSLEHERGTQFVVHVTLEAVKVSWLSDGREASLIAEEIGVAAAKQLGFKRCAGTSMGKDGNSQTWVRPTTSARRVSYTTRP